jgi:hypothetical protein
VDSDRLRRIVRVEARFEGRKPQRGTGFRVGPGQVLTAQHVVERGWNRRSTEPAKEIRVLFDPDGGGELQTASATVVWKGEAERDPGDTKALDVALLADELPEDGLEPFRRWVPLPLGASGRWEASGFATAGSDVDQMGTEYLWGVCHPAKKLATYLKLSIERSAPVEKDGNETKALTWAGISGAPVFVKEGRYEGYLYGVVRSSPESFTDQLYAVGTPALLRNAELRRYLGIEEPVPPHVSLVEKLRGLLEEDSRLAGRLAGLDESWKARWNLGGVDDLVDVICAEGNLKASLEQVRHLFQGLDPSSANAERLREMAGVMVSILASRELPGGADLTAESIRRIRLGTASPNFAEALLASAYGTPCLYERAEGRDLPRPLLRVPSPMMEAGIRAKSHVEEQLEELEVDLIEKELDHPKFIFPSQKKLLSSVPPGEQRELLKRTLEKRLVRLKERYKRPAFLAADAELQKTMGPHLNAFLDRLAKVLPSLHLVVLESETEKIAEAIEQEDALWPLWEVLDLLPKE